MNPVAFLRHCPPFDQLDAEAFGQVESHLEVEAASRGTVLLRRDGEPSHYLYLVCSGSVRLDRGDRTMELLEAGDFFGYPSILAGRVNFDCVVEEDAVLARLPEAVFRQLLSHGDFAAFFLRGIGERMRRLPNPATDLTPTHDLALPIGGLVDRRFIDRPRGDRRSDRRPHAGVPSQLGSGRRRGTRHCHRSRPAQSRAGRGAGSGDAGDHERAAQVAARGGVAARSLVVPVRAGNPPPAGDPRWRNRRRCRTPRC